MALQSRNESKDSKKTIFLNSFIVSLSKRDCFIEKVTFMDDILNSWQKLKRKKKGDELKIIFRCYLNKFKNQIVEVYFYNLSVPLQVSSPILGIKLELFD